MKNILESSKVFEAYATIDCCYWLIKEAQKSLSKPRSPLEAMVDSATGYGAVQAKEIGKDVIDLLEQIIETKKVIDADSSNDKKALKAIQKLQKQSTTK